MEIGTVSAKNPPRKLDDYSGSLLMLSLDHYAYVASRAPDTQGVSS